MSALALPPITAPAKASAPQGSNGAADATGFESLVVASLQDEGASDEAEGTEAARRPANDGVETATLAAVAPGLALPSAMIAVEFVAPGTERAAPPAAAVVEIQAHDGLPLMQGVDGGRSGAPLGAGGPDTGQPILPSNDGDPAQGATAAVGALPPIDPRVQDQAASAQPTGTPPPVAAAPSAPRAGRPADPITVEADAPTPEASMATVAEATGRKGAPEPAAAVSPPMLQAAPPPLRALAERTSRPLDPPSDKTADVSASASGLPEAKAGLPATSVGPTPQIASDRPAGPVDAAQKAVQDDPGSESSVDAAPASESATASTSTAAQARETGLSGLSRATIDATAQIAVQILRKLEGRSTRFEMALTPDDLGRVDVKLDIDSEGRLAARLAFDNPLAATDLRGRVDDLRRELEDAGFQLADDAFEFAERDSGSSSFDRGQDARKGQNRAFAAAASLNEEIDVAQPPRWMTLSLSPSGVDLKV